MRTSTATSLLVALLLLLVAGPALAQQNATGSFPEPEGTLVVFKLGSRVESDADGPSKLPSAIMQRLAQEEALARLDVGAPTPHVSFVQIRAQFVFSSMEAFGAWYESESTETLLQELGAQGAGEAEVAVSVKRFPYARLVDERRD